MKINSRFDGGNIEVVSLKTNDDIQLKIEKDTGADYFQWFYFRLQDAAGYPCKLNIINAGEAYEPEGWKDYNACASYDRLNWFRVPTSFDDNVLSINHTPEYNSVFYAYFAPYSHEQLLDLLHRAQLSDDCILENLGDTVEGRSIDMLIAGEPTKGKKKIWIIARQHPGEPMASWFMEGFISMLLDKNNPVSRKLLSDCVFYLVPNMNVDGSINGNLRANGAGRNLNREWSDPDPENSPEVYHVFNKMEETGVDLNLDIHGDEGLPCNFISGIEGIPGFSNRLENLQNDFIDALISLTPDFQDEHGYPKDKPGNANLSICSKAVAYKFDCLSLTLEMPFKDNKNMPDPVSGWSPERSMILGESVLQAIHSIFPKLR